MMGPLHQYPTRSEPKNSTASLATPQCQIHSKAHYLVVEQVGLSSRKKDEEDSTRCEEPYFLPFHHRSQWPLVDVYQHNQNPIHKFWIFPCNLYTIQGRFLTSHVGEKCPVDEEEFLEPHLCPTLLFGRRPAPSL